MNHLEYYHLQMLQFLILQHILKKIHSYSLLTADSASPSAIGSGFQFIHIQATWVDYYSASSFILKYLIFKYRICLLMLLLSAILDLLMG